MIRLSLDCTYCISSFASELLSILSSHLHWLPKGVRPECANENGGRRHVEAWPCLAVHALLWAIQVRFHVTKYEAWHFL
uniref:Uncharacterized protein n=1 Tax=Zea mays TaxID=4577 RepID=C4IZE0_MAIZE|nr:unknown [Zea mays]